MLIGYVQTAPIFGEKKQNFMQIEDLLKDKKADLIVLPELFATGYTFISKDEAVNLAENIDGITSKFLKKIANLTNAIIVGGFAEKDGNKIYNSAMLVSKTEVIGVYRKIHLYYKEKLWFSPGDKKLKVYEINNFKVGMMICFDWIFPETTRSLALLGADIIAHSANLVLSFCQKAMVTRCLENRVFAITSNRIGNEIRGEDNFNFTGCSQITSYNGEVLSSAPADKIYVDFIEIQLEKARNKNLNEFNELFTDRKPKYYYI
ncbi:MAG: nitrilase-related carbon-nitrogen hydrolase [Promethearchaeota archaeon]